MQKISKNIEKSSALDNTALNNIIEKLQFYMKKTGQSVRGLAHQVNMEYQPLYRLMYRRYFPTISSLQTIANYFNCSVSELTMDEIFIDVPYFNNPNDALLDLVSGLIRVYLPSSLKDLILNKTIFAIIMKDFKIDTAKKNDTTFRLNTNYYQLFFNESKIENGTFLAIYDSKAIILDVTNISNTHVIAKYDKEDKEQQFLINEIHPRAKFLCYVELPDTNPNQLVIYGKPS